MLPSTNNHCKDPAINQDQDKGGRVFKRKFEKYNNREHKLKRIKSNELSLYQWNITMNVCEQLNKRR